LGFFLIAALLRIDTYFSLVYLIAAVYILGRVWTRRTMRQLETERRLVNRAFPGEKIPVELRVRNNGWLPAPWVEMHDSLPIDMISPPFYRRVLSLQPHQEKRFRYTLSCYKRGYYLIGPVIWRTGDLLGFLPQLAAQHRPEYIIIYPRVLSLEKLGLPTRSPLASLPAPAPLFEDPTRIRGVRDYRAGDSPRRIHWTASAATGRLVVKRYQPAIARETLICLDLDEDDYAFQRMIEATELAITTAASLANHIIVREGLNVGLSVQATDPLQEATVRMSLPPRGERAHLIGILEILARAQTYHRRPGLDDDRLPLADFLRRESMRLSWGATIVVITGSETDELFDSLVYLRHQGFAVALVLVMPEPPDEGKEAQAEVLHVPVYRVWREQEVEML
jgi:uncharacterized protein (DUF58 family)